MAFNNWYMTVCFKGKINAQDFMRLCPCLNQHLECLCWSENNLVTSICRCHIFLLPMIAAFVILPFAFPLFNPFCQRSSKPLQTLLSLQTIIMLGKKKLKEERFPWSPEQKTQLGQEQNSRASDTKATQKLFIYNEHPNLPSKPSLFKHLLTLPNPLPVNPEEKNTCDLERMSLICLLY